MRFGSEEPGRLPAAEAGHPGIADRRCRPPGHWRRWLPATRALAALSSLF